MVKKNIPDINVDEIMQKIREEVAKRKAETHQINKQDKNIYQVHERDIVNTEVQETKIWRIIKKIQYKLQKYAFYSFIYNVAFNFKKFIPKYKKHLVVGDLHNYHDEEFIKNAYRAVLKREPDAQGFNRYLMKIRSGKMNKTEILGRLRYSKEGRGKHVKIKGLFLRFLANTSFRIPAIGYILKLLISIIRFPKILRNIQEFEAFTNARFTESTNSLKNITQGVNEQLAQKAGIQSVNEQLAQKAGIQSVNEQLAQKADTQSVNEQLAQKADIQSVNEQLAQKADIQSVNEQLAQKADIQSVNEQLAQKADTQSVNEQLAQKADTQSVNGQLAQKADIQISEEIKVHLNSVSAQVKDHKFHILDQHRRLTSLFEEIRKRLPEPINTEQIKHMLKEEDHLLNALYVSFEDQFRGTREEIKEKAKVYLPYIKEAGAGIKDLPILDIGCGRGEWLELLKEEGLQARGVDINRVMVKQCKERRLKVIEDDMIVYLRNLPDASVRAVTGFHIIEHLPFEALIKLLDETVRVLRPGGIAIFETPNPENVIVGSCNFYLDPTHKKPLPSSMIKFMAEARGLCRVEILNLHPFPESFKLTGPDLSERFNEFFYGPQDYAVIAYKA